MDVLRSLAECDQGVNSAETNASTTLEAPEGRDLSGQRQRHKILESHLGGWKDWFDDWIAVSGCYWKAEGL